LFRYFVVHKEESGSGLSEPRSVTDCITMREAPEKFLSVDNLQNAENSASAHLSDFNYIFIPLKG